MIGASSESDRAAFAAHNAAVDQLLANTLMVGQDRDTPQPVPEGFNPEYGFRYAYIKGEGAKEYGLIPQIAIACHTVSEEYDNAGGTAATLLAFEIALKSIPIAGPIGSNTADMMQNGFTLENSMGLASGLAQLAMLTIALRSGGMQWSSAGASSTASFNQMVSARVGLANDALKASAGEAITQSVGELRAAEDLFLRPWLAPGKHHASLRDHPASLRNQDAGVQLARTLYSPAPDRDAAAGRRDVESERGQPITAALTPAPGRPRWSSGASCWWGWASA
jgi:hypothetical protein